MSDPGTEGGLESRKAALATLRNASFRNLWLGNLLSALGSHISRVSLIVYVFKTYDSVPDLALLMVLETLPGALCAPIAGVVADRFDKRGVMVVADVVRALLMVVILLRPTLAVVFAMAAFHSVFTAFFQPAKSALVPFLVRREELTPANGIDQSASSFAMVIGPIAGAHLVLQFGLAGALTVDILSFLASAVLIARIARPAQPPQEEQDGARSFRDGWRYFVRHELALHLSLLFFIALVCTGVWMPLAPAFIRDHLGGSDAIYGWQIGLFGCGSIVGGLLAPRIARRLGQGATLFAGLLTEGVAMTTYALVPHVHASTLVMFVWGIAVSLVVVPFYSIYQAVIDRRFLGRIFSIVRQTENIALVLSMGAAALLHGLLRSHMVFLFLGLVYLGLTAASSFTQGGRTLLGTR